MNAPRQLRNLGPAVFLGLLVLLIGGRSLVAEESAPTVRITADSPALLPSQFWFAESSPINKSVWERVPADSVVGVIVEIDEREISYVAKDAVVLTKRSSGVLTAIDVRWGSDAAKRAHETYQKGEWGNAILAAKEAIAEGNIPRWQQKFLAGEIVDSLSGLGQVSSACRVFSTLAKESPPPMLFGIAPLCWSTQRGTPQLDDLADKWLAADRSPIEQMMAASWILTTPRVAEGRAVLEQLARSKTPHLAQLATAQLWRLADPTQVKNEYREWQVLRDRMLWPLQLGPSVALADKLERAGLIEASLHEWLRVETLFPDHLREAAFARSSAAALLMRLGRSEEASRLTRQE